MNLKWWFQQVLTGKGRWEKGSFLTGGDKELLLKQVKLVRDSPTEAIYTERETRLLQMSEGLLVRAGQTLNEVPFKDYYTKCWKDCAFRWVLAFRKNLPTKGCNDTQVIDLAFKYSVIWVKWYFQKKLVGLKSLFNVMKHIFYNNL